MTAYTRMYNKYNALKYRLVHRLASYRQFEY